MMTRRLPQQDARPALGEAIEAACSRIAPTWPLDRFAAVNPFWGFADMSMPQAAQRLAWLSGARLLMPRAWFRQQWQQGRLTDEHIRQAMAELQADCTLGQIHSALQRPDPMPKRFALYSELLSDTVRPPGHMTWSGFVTDHISRHCATYFDRAQARWSSPGEGLYPSWLRTARADVETALAMGLKGFRAMAARLPDTPRALIAHAADGLGVPPTLRETYFSAALLSINGWAAWCAYQRWQTRLADAAEDDHLEHLLAIRLAWEYLLLQLTDAPQATRQWHRQMRTQTPAPESTQASPGLGWVLQRALEISYQYPLAQRLSQAAASTDPMPDRAAAQAVFCIDTRSEVFRRALEQTAPSVQTLGFAGFFGLPVAYSGLAQGEPIPHLPVLFAPQWQVTDTTRSAQRDSALAGQHRRRQARAQSWRSFRSAAASGFSFVEATGLFYATKLLRASLPARSPVGGQRTDRTPRPAFSHSLEHGGAIRTEDQVTLAAGALTALSLTRDFGRLLLLVGHGTETANNAHAAALDCGACGGQSGALNAHLLAILLNEPAVRCGLRARGIELPDDTWVLAGLHNTTTDELSLLDSDSVPESHRQAVEQLRGWLEQAGERARAERGTALLRAQPGGESGARGALIRAHDWAQLRPEWGLADNAAFVIAPRTLTRHLDLKGRVFLHDYRWQDDEEGTVLEQILTGPMVVTHWINMQYYASTVDNLRYGSGNKVLHNVVGGNIGVLEGNRGDLRIGLPLQSVRDAQGLMHTPRRLSVWVLAPRHRIESILARHERIRRLVDNEWLSLWALDAQEGTAYLCRQGRWQRPAASA